MFGIIDELEAEYRRVRCLYKLIFEANIILKQEAKTEKVQADMQAYVYGLKNLRFRRRDEKAVVLNILRFTASYWVGLFYHYDRKQIPRTNNDLEVYNRGLKAAYRKTTGRSSCQRYIVRYGAYVALLDSSLCQRETLARLRSVPYGVFRLCYGELRSFRFRLSFKQSLSKDLEGFFSVRNYAGLKQLFDPCDCTCVEDNLGHIP